jgi:hypothetical protein
VAAGVGAAQVTHEVDDAVQLVGLEGEQPLVVAEREAGHRVGAHVRVLAGHHAMLGEHPAALGRVEEVPLVGADVDADVAPRLLLGEERRNVPLVELGRTVQRHRGPRRLAGLAEPGPAERRVGLLQLLGGRGDGPQQVVGVGAHPLDVVDAPGDDALARRLRMTHVPLPAMGHARR